MHDRKSVETNSESASSFIIGAYTATWHNTTYSNTIVIPRNICLCVHVPVMHDRKSVQTNGESASSFIIGAYTATWHNTTYSKTIVIPRNICLCLPFLIHDRLACGNRYGYAPPHCPRPASLQPVGQWYAPQRGVYYQRLRSARGPRPSVQLQRGSLCWVEAIVVEELQLQAGRNALSSVGSETAPCAFASPLFQTSTTQSEKQSRVLCPVRVSV